jgi:spoIIIJ-associated protein
LTIDQTNLTSEQIRILIGTGASVLDGIQYLANSVLNLNQPEENQQAYTVELNGYRVRREAEIRTLAETAAAEVRFSGREVELQSLSSSERRQIHTLLQEFSDLETFSRGKEPNRHLVVRQAVTQ